MDKNDAIIAWTNPLSSRIVLFCCALVPHFPNNVFMTAKQNVEINILGGKNRWIKLRILGSILLLVSISNSTFCFVNQIFFNIVIVMQFDTPFPPKGTWMLSTSVCAHSLVSKFNAGLLIARAAIFKERREKIHYNETNDYWHLYISNVLFNTCNYHNFLYSFDVRLHCTHVSIFVIEFKSNNSKYLERLIRINGLLWIILKRDTKIIQSKFVNWDYRYNKSNSCNDYFVP